MGLLRMLSPCDDADATPCDCTGGEFDGDADSNCTACEGTGFLTRDAEIARAIERDWELAEDRLNDLLYGGPTD